MAEPEPERVSSSSQPSLQPESEHPAEVEPLPEWSTAKLVWGPAWQVHVYGIGTLYLLVAVQCGVSLVKLLHKSGVRRKKVHTVNLALLLVFGLTRALYLLLDAYHSSKLLPVTLVKVLWGIGQPCIITAFVLVFIVLKNALVMKQRFRTWYTTRNIAFITLPYFIFVFTAEMTVSFVPLLKGLTFTCQLLYVLFTVFLVLFYSFIGFKIWQKKRDLESSAERLQEVQRSRLKSFLHVCFAALIGGVLLCVSQIYAMVGVYGVFAKTHVVLPWPWFGFNTAQRLLELYLCVLLCRMLASKSSTSVNQQNNSVTTNSSLVQPGNNNVLVTRQVTKVNNEYASAMPGCLNTSSIQLK